MSQFLSSRLLRFRQASRKTIDHDQICRHCGYNLRGLNVGRNCPECGNIIEPITTGTDLLASGEWPMRWRWRLGALLGAFCLIVVILARWALLVGGVQGAPDALAYGYLGTGLTIALLWSIATWMLTPPELDQHWPSRRTWRLAVRASQILWVIGYVIWIVRFHRTSGAFGWVGVDHVLETAQILCRAIAGVGALALAWMLLGVTDDAELDDASRRLNAAIWGLPIFTMLPQLFPAALEWYALVPLGLLLVGWTWFVWLYARALLDMHSHARWAMIHGRDSQSRAARTDATRQELQAEVSQMIRPICREPGEDDPIPLEPPPSRPVR